MQQDTSSLAALIGSRICHDLISPIGAISNGLELVSMGAPNRATPEMSLIQQSCDNATARIRFFRIAFGSSGDNRPIPLREVRKTLSNHYEGTRITPDWRGQDDIGRDAVQLGYLAVLCVETALPQGGTITVSATKSKLVVTASGPAVVVEDALWDRLRTDSAAALQDLRPAHVQFALLGALCPHTPRLQHDAGPAASLSLHIPISDTGL